MTLLCDVVVEVSKERKVPSLARQHSSSMHGESSDEVSDTKGRTVLLMSYDIFSFKILAFSTLGLGV
jgi:hypothetical protein